MADPYGYGRHSAPAMAAAAAAAAAAAPAAVVSVLDVFTRLVEVQVQLGAIQAQLADLPDHETRIRLLERFRYTLAGFAILAGGASGYIGYLIGRR